MVADKKLMRIQRQGKTFALYEKSHSDWSLEGCYETQAEAFEVAKFYGRHVSVIFR